jgi:hypothetical protein
MLAATTLSSLVPSVTHNVSSSHHKLKFVFFFSLTTKLKIIRRLNLLVSQPFLYIYIYICIGQYTIIMVVITTWEYAYNISYIDKFYNIPPQAEGGGSTWSLNRKVVNGAVESSLVKTYASWSWEEIKRIWISFLIMSVYQGKKENSTVQNNTVSGFSFFFLFFI